MEQQVLPIVRINGTAYYIDLVQRQFRDVMLPRDHISFDSVKGIEMRHALGVVTCLACGMSVMIAERLEKMRCLRCGRQIE